MEASLRGPLQLPDAVLRPAVRRTFLQSAKPVHLLAAATLALLAAASSPAAGAPLSSTELATLRETTVSRGASVPTDAAIALSRKIGREGNVDGLRAIVDTHMPELTRAATEAFASESSRVLPAPLEGLIVEYYADPEERAPLLGLIARGVDKSGRFPEYASRDLFDRLYTDLKSNPRENGAYAYKLVATQLKGIEAQLVTLLPLVGGDSANELVVFLGQRRYAAAVPALAQLIRSTPRARYDNELFEHIVVSLLQIATPDAVQAVLDRLSTLAREDSDPRASGEIARILTLLAAMPPDTRPDYPALRGSLARELSPGVQPAMVQLIAARKDQRGLPEVTAALARGNDEALTTLLDLGAPDDWRAGATQIERAASAGALKPERAAAMQRRLAAALENPSRFMAQRSAIADTKAFNDARSQLNRDNAAIADYRESDPPRYALETENVLRRAELLIASNPEQADILRLRRDTGTGYRQLADYTRFTLNDPVHAVALYQSAIALSQTLPPREGGGLMERLGLADTLRFDLKDVSQSRKTYEELLRQLLDLPASDRDGEAVFRRALGDWLSAEIAFLGKGERYAGTLTPEQVAPLMMIVIYGSDGFSADDPPLRNMAKVLHFRSVTDDEKIAFARQLESLSPSQAHLLGALDFLPLLGSPDRIAAYMRRHDPAGYVTSGVFSVWHDVEKQVAARPLPQRPPGIRMFTWSESDRALMRKAEAILSGRRI